MCDYAINKHIKDGYSTECRSCTALRNKKQYDSNPEKRRSEAAAYRENSPEKAKEANEKSRNKRKDEINAFRRIERQLMKEGVSKKEIDAERRSFTKKYRLDPEFKALADSTSRSNSIEAREIQRRLNRTAWEKKNVEHRTNYQATYYAANRERILAVNAQWRIENPEKIQNHRHKRRSQAGGSEFTKEHLHWIHVWLDHKCFGCGKELNRDFHLDHVWPLSRGGENSDENAVYMCSSCNMSKSNRVSGVAWKSREFHPVQLQHAGFSKEIAAALQAEYVDETVRLNGKHVFIASTFAFSRGNVALPDIYAEHPDWIFVWDYEWKYEPQAVLNVLQAKLGISEKIGARKLIADIIDSTEALNFMDKWHIQGSRSATAYVCLRTKDGDLKAVAGLTEKNGSIELTRMVFKGSIAGGVSKLLKFFRETYAYSGPITSYCDLRYGPGKGYLAAGFAFDGDTDLSYSYVNSFGIHHRLRLAPGHAPKILAHYDPKLSEEQNAMAHGYRKLIGLPQRRFVHSL